VTSYGIGLVYFLGTGCYLSSILYLPVSLAVLVFYTYPLMTVVFESALDRRLPRLLDVVAFLVAFGGLALALQVSFAGLDPRGIDVDKNGVVWTALAASSHLASFDRRKCKALTGARKPDGTDCPEGWTLYLTPGPKFKGTEVPADFHYYNWVDRHNIMGFGANTPLATGSNSDSLLVLNPQTRQWVTLRVPYPLGFYSRGMDGRIDDAKAGWKGRGVWTTISTRTPFHMETGRGTTSKVMKFQMRPDPLAK